MLRWALHLKGGPHRDFHAGVVVGDKVYYFKADGNMYNREHMNVHVLNTVSLRWKKLPRMITELERPFEVPSKLPAMLDYYTPVLIQDTVYLWGWYGKHTKKSSNVLFGFDVGSHRWFKPKTSGTLPEEKPHYTVSALGKVIYIVGGSESPTGLTNDVYRLDTATMVWEWIDTKNTVSPSSEPRFAAIIEKKMLVFGLDHTVRTFDTETNGWLGAPSAQLPEECWERAAFVGPCKVCNLTTEKCRCPDSNYSFFTHNGQLYVFRSCNTKPDSTDMWKFNPKTFSWMKVVPKGVGPSPTSSMVCCGVGDRVFFFGGKSTPDDLYILDISDSRQGPYLKTLCKQAVSRKQLQLPAESEMAALATA